MSEKIYFEGIGDSEIRSNYIKLYDIESNRVSNSIPISDKPSQIFYSADVVEKFLSVKIEGLTLPVFSKKNVPIEYVVNSKIDLNKLISTFNDYKDSLFITNNGGFFRGGIFYKYDFNLNNFSESTDIPLNIFMTFSEVEKMSKSKYNVVTPDDLVEKYGADTLRLYEMFLGPLEQHKPWDTQGIEGVFRFIRKLWKLYHDYDNNLAISDEEPTKAELKVLHKTIKKIQEDIERFSFNTAVSTFMICVNELSELKCNKRSILKELPIILSPYAPHIAEELWSLLGNKETVTYADFPAFNEEYLVENSCNYAVSFNGKMRFTIELPANMPAAEVEKNALEHKDAAKWLEGKTPKKVIVVPKKIVNVVV